MGGAAFVVTTAAVDLVTQNIDVARTTRVIRAIAQVGVFARLVAAEAAKATLPRAAGGAAGTAVGRIAELVDLTTVIPLLVTVEIVGFAARNDAPSILASNVSLALRAAVTARGTVDRIGFRVRANVGATFPIRRAVASVRTLRSTRTGNARRPHFAVGICRTAFALVRRYVTRQGCAFRRITGDCSAVIVRTAANLAGEVGSFTKKARPALGTVETLDTVLISRVAFLGRAETCAIRVARTTNEGWRSAPCARSHAR